MHDHSELTPLAEDPELSYYARRTNAIEALLIEKGVLTAEEVRRSIDDMDSKSPAVGARVVAKAWVDRDFKTRLLTDARTAIAGVGLNVSSRSPSYELVALENTDTVHHAIVCTLCSCYPFTLLGRPPAWYKSVNYRARVVIDPRDVLREFGLVLAPEVEVRVHDSTADVRYLVIPKRPSGTESMSEEELAALVTRDSMIGVAEARTPD